MARASLSTSKDKSLFALFLFFQPDDEPNHPSLVVPSLHFPLTIPATLTKHASQVRHLQFE